MGDEVVVRHLGPVLATSRSFACVEEGEEKEACRKEALRAAQAQCALLGGNCILEVKADVTPALDDGVGARAKDCYVVSGNACILTTKAGATKASAANVRNDGRIRDGPARNKPARPDPPEKHGESKKRDGRIREAPARERAAAAHVVGGVLLNAVDGFDSDTTDWTFDGQVCSRLE